MATNRDAALIERDRTGACNSGALSPNGVVLYTKRPTVAYTYVSASYVPPNANLPAKQYTPATVVYDCLGIPANHAFSVVGLYQKDGIQYLVSGIPGESQGMLLPSVKACGVVLPQAW